MSESKPISDRVWGDVIHMAGCHVWDHVLDSVAGCVDVRILDRLRDRVQGRLWSALYFPIRR